METIKNYLPQIFIGLGVIFSFLGGLIIYLRTNEFNNDIRLKTEENKTLSQKNIELTNESKELLNHNITLSNINTEFSERNLDLTTQNLKLSTKIKEQAEIINSNVTGGDSYCHLSLTYSNSDECKIMLVNEGIYPLYGIQIRIVDLDEFRQITNHTLETLTKNTYNIEELHGNMAMILGTLYLKGRPNIAGFNIFFNAKNGSFTQLLRIRKKDNKWYQASKITRDNSIIYEKIDNDFPYSSKNEDIWNY